MSNEREVLEDANAEQHQAKLLANILVLTEEMLASARMDQWEFVTAQERERGALLKQCFSISVPESQSVLFSEALAAMLHMNEEIIGLLEVAKGNVAIKRNDQRHTKRSLGHYLDIEKNH